MIKKCHGCGVEKDDDLCEIYPYSEDCIVDDRPIPVFMELECEPTAEPEKHENWKVPIVCHECFHKIQPDMWISERCWLSINPVTPFCELPKASNP